MRGKEGFPWKQIIRIFRHLHSLADSWRRCHWSSSWDCPWKEFDWPPDLSFDCHKSIQCQDSIQNLVVDIEGWGYSSSLVSMEVCEGRQMWSIDSRCHPNYCYCCCYSLDFDWRFLYDDHLEYCFRIQHLDCPGPRYGSRLSQEQLRHCPRPCGRWRSPCHNTLHVNNPNEMDRTISRDRDNSYLGLGCKWHGRRRCCIHSTSHALAVLKEKSRKGEKT